jgi:hypothetical protein
VGSGVPKIATGERDSSFMTAAAGYRQRGGRVSLLPSPKYDRAGIESSSDNRRMSKDAWRPCGARPGAPRARRGWTVALVMAAMVGGSCDVPTGLPRLENTLALPAPEIEVPVTGTMTPAIPVTVDLSGVDEAMVERARGGELELTPVDPENGTGTLQVTISDPASGTTVSQTITVAPDGQPQVIAVSGDAMRSFLGGDVEVSVSGALGPATVPLRTVTLETLLRITFEIGGED